MPDIVQQPACSNSLRCPILGRLVIESPSIECYQTREQHVEGRNDGRGLTTGDPPSSLIGVRGGGNSPACLPACNDCRVYLARSRRAMIFPSRLTDQRGTYYFSRRNSLVKICLDLSGGFGRHSQLRCNRK